MTNSDEPTLPLELEEQIFLLAFDLKPSNAWNFVLVAKRVHYWLIPRIFKIVILYGERSSPIPFCLPAITRYAEHIHYFFFSDNAIIAHLPLFTNIRNLVICREIQPSELKALLTLEHLTTLSIAITDSIEILPPVYFAVFAKLTHLDLNTICTSWSARKMEPFINFPLLTHLCVLVETNHLITKLFLDRNRCSNLKVVVLWGPLTKVGTEETIITPEDELEDYPLEDGRLVQVLSAGMVNDWENGVKGGDDMWTLADREIEARNQI